MMFKKQAHTETPLLLALRQCNVAEQREFAELAGTTRNYLYQVATCHRVNPSADLVRRISQASKTMFLRTTGRVPKLSMEELSMMCSIR